MGVGARAVGAGKSWSCRIGGRDGRSARQAGLWRRRGERGRERFVRQGGPRGGVGWSWVTLGMEEGGGERGGGGRGEKRREEEEEERFCSG